MAETLPFQSIQPRDGFWYRGVRFARLLEHDWAVALDRLGLPWTRLDPDGDRFVPTFYLPASRQYLHVDVSHPAGPLSFVEIGEWKTFVRAQPPRPHTSEDTPDLRLVIGREHGEFEVIAREGSCIAPVLLYCIACGGWWWADEAMGWACQCCGAYEGDGHIGDRRGRLQPFPAVEVPWAA